MWVGVDLFSDVSGVWLNLKDELVPLTRAAFGAHLDSTAGFIGGWKRYTYGLLWYQGNRKGDWVAAQSPEYVANSGERDISLGSGKGRPTWWHNNPGWRIPLRCQGVAKFEGGVMANKCYEPPPPGWKYIFRPWVRDPKTGVVRYPRNGKVFVLLVPDE